MHYLLHMRGDTKLVAAYCQGRGHDHTQTQRHVPGFGVVHSRVQWQELSVAFAAIRGSMVRVGELVGISSVRSCEHKEYLRWNR